MRYVLAVLTAAGMLAGFGAEAGAVQSTHALFDGDASFVGEFAIALDAGETVQLETAGLSSGSDPILHLLDDRGRQVAMNDNGAGGTAARLVYRAAAKKVYRLIVRARSASTAGTADVLKNGTAWQRAARFAGLTIELDGLLAGETLESVRLPNGAGPLHALYMLASDGVGIEQRVSGGGVSGAAQYAVTRNLGTRQVVLAVPRGRIALGSPGPVAGRARLLRNDAGIPGHDSDGDGLGNELENALDTCASSSDIQPGVPCGSLADARDTDGDGIGDRLEAIGKRAPGDVATMGTGGILQPGGLPLPLWGASPRHKDLFVEVDFMRRTKTENDGDVSLKMPASVARGFADIYGDAYTVDPALRLAHAADLRNPDGRPGISVHLDIGRPPESTADATVFGDWGGYTAVDAVEADGKYMGAVANEAWKTSMREERRGIFRYALAYGTGGGQAGVGFAASYNFNSAVNAAHETGHSLGLKHQGVPDHPFVDVNCKPNYPSIMNYAFTSGVGFSDGRPAAGPTLNNWALRESNVAPPSATAFFDTLEGTFGYWVDRTHGAVDWNRDGELAPAGTTVRAYANYRAGGGGCEFTRYNQVQVGGTSELPPAIERLGGRLYVFRSRGGALYYSKSSSTWNCPQPAEGCAGGVWTSGPSSGLGAGTGVDAVRVRLDGRDELLVVAASGLGLYERRLSLFLGNELWTGWRRIPGNAPFGQPSLARAADGSVLLAYRGRATNRYYTNRWTPSGSWSGERAVVDGEGNPLSVKSDSLFSPAIVEAPLDWSPVGGIYGLFAGEGDWLDLWHLDRTSGRWERTDLLDSHPLGVLYRPALAWVPAAPPAAKGRLYVLYTDADDGLAKLMTSHIRVDETSSGLVKRQRIGLDGPFDNVWALISGADLLYDPGVDTNLRAVLVHGPTRGDTARELWFRPKADGINSFSYGNANDWPVLRTYLCRHVVNPGGVVARPIRCA